MGLAMFNAVASAHPTLVNTRVRHRPQHSHASPTAGKQCISYGNNDDSKCFARCKWCFQRLLLETVGTRPLSHARTQCTSSSKQSEYSMDGMLHWQEWKSDHLSRDSDLRDRLRVCTPRGRLRSRKFRRSRCNGHACSSCRDRP